MTYLDHSEKLSELAYLIKVASRKLESAKHNKERYNYINSFYSYEYMNRQIEIAENTKKRLEERYKKLCHEKI